MTVRFLHFAALVSFAVLVACSSTPAPPPADAEERSADAGGREREKRDAGPPLHRGAAALTACARRPGGTESITRFVEHANTLPPPVDAACVVASLPRPLALVATANKVSAQPAASAKSPRVFVLFDALVVSVVPEGDGATFVELGEWVAPGRTLKGELELPLTAPVSTDAAFTRIEQSNQTTACAGCHREEAAHASVPHGYVSAAFRPNAGPVSVAALEREHDACVQTNDTSSRCAMFHALFDFGPVTGGSFPNEAETFP